VQGAWKAKSSTSFTNEAIGALLCQRSIAKVPMRPDQNSTIFVRRME
jgi:hypothetical protein